MIESGAPAVAAHSKRSGSLLLRQRRVRASHAQQLVNHVTRLGRSRRRGCQVNKARVPTASRTTLQNDASESENAFAAIFFRLHLVEVLTPLAVGAAVPTCSSILN